MSIPRRWPLLVSVAFLAVAVVAAIWRGPLPLESLLLRAVVNDQNLIDGQMKFDLNQLRQGVRLYIVFGALIAAMIVGLLLFSEHTWAFLRGKIFQLAIFLACSSALFLLLMRGYQGPWYPIETLMKNPQAVPIFGHRLMWVWVANLCQKLVPSLTYLQCYFLSQIPPILLAVFVIGRWSGLFIGRSLGWIGQPLLVAIMGPTLSYYTFYDFSIVFFYGLCLLLLYERRYVWFAIGVGVATFNHENALLLIVVAALETFLRNRRVCAWLTLSSLFLHLAARFVMQYAFPSGRIVDWHLWTNLVFPLIHPRLVLVGVVAVVFWWVAVALCWRGAEPFLHVAAILFPLLAATNFVYGQVNEARVFDASIPVAIAFVLSYAKGYVTTTSVVRPAAV